MGVDKRSGFDRDAYGRPINIVLFGKDADHWAGVDQVMQAHGIETAKELNDKLGRKKWPRIKVVDAGNTKRLLGSLPRPNVEPRGERLRMAVSEPMTAYRDEFRMAMVHNYEVKTLDFTITELRSGWDIELTLTTSDTLERLLKLPEFRLPGETASQAKRRWEMQTFG
nr:hypothetical protein [Methylobacterium sp. ZNC0032]